MVKLVYIGGYGHSGSTLLEYLMTGCPDLVGCGEVVNARRGEASARTCSCGQPTAQCPVWRFISDPALEMTHWSHGALDMRLLDQVAANYAAMVDSTKTAWRAAAAPFALRHKLSQDFRLVHIVRDPRAVCWSLLKRARRVGAQSNDIPLSIKTTLGWCYANSACELFGRIYPDNYARIRYEDLATDPCAVMISLMRTVLPWAQWDYNAIGSQDNRHQLYANRMRSQELPLESIKLDNEWQTEMPRKLRRLVELLSWPLCARYGYLQSQR